MLGKVTWILYRESCWEKFVQIVILGKGTRIMNFKVWECFQTSVLHINSRAGLLCQRKHRDTRHRPRKLWALKVEEHRDHFFSPKWLMCHHPSLGKEDGDYSIWGRWRWDTSFNEGLGEMRRVRKKGLTFQVPGISKEGKCKSVEDNRMSRRRILKGRQESVFSGAFTVPSV